MTGAASGIMAAERLVAAVDELAVELAAAPEHTFTRRATPDGWTAAEVVGHMVEMLPYWAGVARDVAAAPGSPFGRALDDPDRVGAVAAANAIPRAEALARLRAAAHEAATVLGALSDEAWEHTGTHPSRGELTVGTVIRTLVLEHAEEHCRQALTAAGIAVGE